MESLRLLATFIMKDKNLPSLLLAVPRMRCTGMVLNNMGRVNDTITILLLNYSGLRSRAKMRDNLGIGPCSLRCGLFISPPRYRQNDPG